MCLTLLKVPPPTTATLPVASTNVPLRSHAVDVNCIVSPLFKLYQNGIVKQSVNTLINQVINMVVGDPITESSRLTALDQKVTSSVYVDFCDSIGKIDTIYFLKNEDRN
jgi:hypothetical protein